MSSIKNSLRPVKVRSYLNRDFDAFKVDLLRHVRTYFPDKIQDFSEASVGGMLLDMSAYVGDVLSFYLDHQFKELSVDTAVETKNIQNLLTMAGVKIVGASPSIVDIRVTITVPSKLQSGVYQPDASLLPKVTAGSTAVSTSGVIFEISEDLDFALRDTTNRLVATTEVLGRDTAGNPTSYSVSRTITCMSGQSATENFTVDSSFRQFRRISLTNSNVTEIARVVDAEGNRYYEVDTLAQDTVFSSIVNTGDDRDIVPYVLELLPAPYRFVSSMSLGSGITTLLFGSGDASTLDNDIIPDPSEVALPLFGKRQVSRVAIDPQSILGSGTLGYAPVGTTLSVTYKHGGGVDHNIEAGAIAEFDRLSLKFPGGVETAAASRVRASISVTNPSAAAGGDAAPTIDELKLKIPAARNAQNRIVSVPDLLARIYTMPSSFGRVYRAGVFPSSVDPAVTNLYVCSRDINDQIVVSPDTLKKNLRSYLNQFRLISDNIDILDARVLNYRVSYSVTTEYDQNTRVVLQNINTRLRTLLATTNFQVGQPILIGDLHSIIINTPGVSSVMSVRINSVSGTVDGRVYADSTFNPNDLLKNNVLYSPPGSLFELKYPDYDIIGSAK